MSVIVGITGNFAAGKTALLRHVSESGYPCFSSDDSVHKLYTRKDIVEKVKTLFPEMVDFNKLLLAQIIYKDPGKRKILEDFIHPLVARELENFIVQYNGSKLAFMEIPLLFEAGWEKYCTYIITVFCDRDIRKERSLARGVDIEMFEAIEKVQMPQELKCQKSHFTIDASVPLEEELKEFDKILPLLV